MRAPKTLFFITCAVLAIIIACVIIFDRDPLPKPIAIDTTHQPTIGYPKAKVHIVVIEEPKCSDCKRYNNTIFPVIKKNYIDTNKVLYTVIPVSFLPHSMPAAIALLCVYHQDASPNNDLFFTYLDYIYKHEPPEHTDWASAQSLTALAQKASPSIKLPKLTPCINKERYFNIIRANTTYAKKLLGGTIQTPSIFVNGHRLTQLTLKNMEKLIHEVLLSVGEQ